MRQMFGVAAIGFILAACEARTPRAEQATENNDSARDLAAAPTDSGPATPSDSEKPVALAATAAGLQWGPCPPGMPQGCEIAVLHGDPAKPNADIFLRVPAGSPIAPHWHSSPERMMLATGRLEV